MPNESNNNMISKIIGAAITVFILVYLAITIIGPDEESLDDIIKDINVKTVPHPMGHVLVPPGPNNSLAEDLPEISKYPPQVDNSTSSYIEIFSSTEKAGSGADGWLTEVARNFMTRQ